MATSKDFQKRLAERRAERHRTGIVPLDPVDELAGRPEERKSTPKPQKSSSTEEQKTAASDASLTAPVDPRLMTVVGETPIKMGWHMYPTRHRQVAYEAFVLSIKPWEVNEIALREYFERRYGHRI